MSDNIQQMIIDLLNQASIYGKDTMRVQHLRHIQELILRKYPTLLEQFLNEVLAFQTDKSIEVKKTIILFIEEACQINPMIIIKVIDHLYFLLHDDNIFVRKKLILSLSSIYKSTIMWLIKLSSIDQTIHQMWQRMTQINDHILTQLNCNNDGFCSIIIKFIEMLIIVLIEYEDKFPLDNTHILSRNQCKQNEKILLEKLITFIHSQSLSHYQLITGIETLINIIRYRIDYLNQILSTFEILHKNLSSNFTETQINDIHKILKLKLFNLLKYSTSSNSQTIILNFLTHIGSTETEILKYLPKRSSEFKRKLPINNQHQITKKSKNINNYSIETISNSLNDLQQSSYQQQTMIDFIKKLSIENVVDLVLTSMKSLPQTIPLSFQTTYTPIQDAGSPAQIEYLANLLHNQLIQAGYNLNNNLNFIDNRNISLTSMKTNTISSIQMNNIKPYKFFNMIKTIEHNEIQRMSIDSFNRILSAKDQSIKFHFNHIHQKIIISLVCTFDDTFRNIFREYILDNISQRYHLAFAWIYQTYIHANGYFINQKKDFTKYDYLLCQLLEDFQDNNHDFFFRLLKTVPYITNNALCILERYCQNKNNLNMCMKILYHFILYRISIRDKCLNILLNITHNENKSIRENAISMIKILYEKNEFQLIIEKYILQSLKISLNLETIFNDSTDVWSENTIARYFSLSINLIPVNHRLIQPFVNVYPTVNKNIQRMICQILEIPIREINTMNFEIQELIENCPKGAESLIIHIINILIKQLKSLNELIESIRIFFRQRTIDIQLLIPILPYLGKCELKLLLPQIIKLPSSMIKDIFNELLTVKNTLSPSELFIALHEISLGECELKIIINATTLCFNERSIYTDVVLTDIIENLIEMIPIPLLLMRTVLQTFCLYPKMISFIMKILQQLIIKQVWKQTRIWEGFIKCCEITRPHSLSLLLQLPVPQLKDVCQTAITLHNSLRSYLRSMSINQRSLISPSILEVIEHNSENLTS